MLYLLPEISPSSAQPSQFIQLEFSQSSSTIKWCITWTVNQTFTCDFIPSGQPRSGVQWTQKWKTRLLRTQSSKALPSTLGTGQYVVMYATPSATNYFLAKFYPSGPFTWFFFLSKISLGFFLCWLWLTPVLVWVRRLKQVTLLIVTDNWCRFPCWVPADYR